MRYISALENQAQNVTLETLETLAVGMGVAVSDLVGDQANVEPLQIKQAKGDFDRALTLLHKYRTVMERQAMPPKRAKKSR